MASPSSRRKSASRSSPELLNKLLADGTQSLAGRKLEAGESFFVDLWSQEYSRDIEPMRGGHTDNYYYQLASWVRRFKGVRPPPAPSLRTRGRPHTLGASAKAHARPPRSGESRRSTARRAPAACPPRRSYRLAVPRALAQGQGDARRHLARVALRIDAHRRAAIARPAGRRDGS